MLGVVEITRDSVIEQMNIPWVSRSIYCSTFRDMKELIYLGRNTSPLSERSTSLPANLSVFLPLAKPKVSNTENGASVDSMLRFIMPVCFITWCE